MHGLSYENEFDMHVDGTHFDIKGHAPRLALRKRYKATRKWPIKIYFMSSAQGMIIYVTSEVEGNKLTNFMLTRKQTNHQGISSKNQCLEHYAVHVRIDGGRYTLFRYSTHCSYSKVDKGDGKRGQH